MADEGEVLNSQRRLLRVAYTPLSVPVERPDGDLLMKGAFLRFLGLTDEERRELELDGNAESVIAGIAEAQTENEYIAAVRQMASVGREALPIIASTVAEVRQVQLSNITQGIRELDTDFVANVERTSRPVMERREQGGPIVGSVTAAARLVGEDDEPPFLEQNMPRVPTRASIIEELRPNAERSKLNALIVQELGPAIAGRFVQALEWASTKRESKLNEIAEALNVPMSGEGFPYQVDDIVVAANIVLPEMKRRHLIAKRVAELISQRVFDLVGLLHLERLVMTPVGVERGELLYSLPLAPKETVTLSHKEWAIREEEYSRYIQDYMENYSETGVAQTTEMAKSTDTQTRRQDATSANLTSMSAQPVTITSPVNTSSGTVVDASASIQESVAQTKTITSKASSRTVQDHRVSFTVTTVRGTEDWTSRLLRNTQTNKSMMIDYFRRMRRWRNELYRYGVRLTYDIVVPHPGRRLLARYNRIRELEEQLGKGFQTSLGPNSISPTNWKGFVNTHKVALPPPPPDLEIEETRTINYSGPQVDHTEELTLGVAQGYKLKNLGFQVYTGIRTDGNRGGAVSVGPYTWSTGESNAAPEIKLGPQDVPLTGIGISDRGPIKAAFILRRATFGTIRLYSEITPTTETLENWKKQCWAILREAELARYQEKQDAARIERLHLQRAIDAADSLSLRRIEREHIMLASLEWLFPFLNLKAGWFDNVADTPTDFDRVMGLQASVLIKLMHTAIDWDSMIVNLLPFFWERIDQDAVVFVDHPDPLHREFLRAGAARVVLPIRPGSEEIILSLFDLGLVSSMSPSHPYKAIVDKVTEANESYLAQTHPAEATLADGTIDPAYEGDYPLEGGNLIGRWHETMPTGALDMEVTLQSVN